MSNTSDRSSNIEEISKYHAQRRIFDKIRGVWVGDNSLSRVFDITSQSKQKRRSKR